ncbi:MAG: hypothetical protein ACK5B9_02870 [Flavobacteriia bacterium]|jgi:hypothetical protein
MKNRIIMEILLKEQMKKKKIKTFDRSLVVIGVHKLNEKSLVKCN